MIPAFFVYLRSLCCGSGAGVQPCKGCCLDYLEWISIDEGGRQVPLGGARTDWIQVIQIDASPYDLDGLFECLPPSRQPVVSGVKLREMMCGSGLRQRKGPESLPPLNANADDSNLI